MSEVCSRTGLAFVEGPLLGHRVAMTRWGPVNPPERSVETDPSMASSAPIEAGADLVSQGVDRSKWSRFDTPGSTIYLAEDRRTAYAEILAMARVSRKFRSAISFVSEHFGISWEEARRRVCEEWAASGHRVPDELPDDWRTDRRAFLLQVEHPLRWVDLTAAETIAALNLHLGQQLEDKVGVEEITLGVLAGPDRVVTTFIAEWTRKQVLDDGSYAAGIQAHSKYGGGLCWAYWLRRRDDGLGGDAVSIVDESHIEAYDPDLQHVLKMYGLDVR